MKKICLLTTLLAIGSSQTRQDCIGLHYRGYDRTWHNNTGDLTFKDSAICICPCTGEWTKGGMCKQCNHTKDRLTADQKQQHRNKIKNG